MGLPNPRGRRGEEPVTLDWLRSNCALTTPPADALARPVQGPCWVWLGACNTNGYAAVSKTSHGQIGHVVAYALANGATPAEDLDHLCRQRMCINPAHLEPVSRTENARRGARSVHADPTVCARCGGTDLQTFTKKNGQRDIRCRPCESARRKACRDAKRNA